MYEEFYRLQVFQENLSIVWEYLAYSDPAQILFKILIINANLFMTSRFENSIGDQNQLECNAKYPLDN